MKKGKNIKPHIGIFGRRNTGKSSFINMITGQNLAIVSDTPGTTTDPVKKSIEIFGIGPAIIIDTAGIDDLGLLGEKRIEKTMEVLKTVDCAILLISENDFGSFEKKLIEEFNKWDIPYLLLHNKSDFESISKELKNEISHIYNDEIYDISTLKPYNLDFIIEQIRKTIPENIFQKKSLLGSFLKPNDVVLLITPIDKEAPDGRMILPQQMTIRDVLDNHGICITIQHTELDHFLKTSDIKPVIAITDSQVFDYVKNLIPDDLPLTSFSVLFANHKGDFKSYLKGTQKLGDLKNNDKILILESCTHHVNCDDIGRFKLPRWIQDFSQKKLEFDIVSGLSKIPRPIEEYALVIQCGACMVTEKQLKNRLLEAKIKQIPISNYGLSIAFMNGIFERAAQPFI